MPHDVKLVVDDLDFRDVLLDRVEERPPHVHRRELDAAGLPHTQLFEEEVEIFLFASTAAHPDGPAAVEVADNDAVVVTLADRDLVNTDHAGRWHPCPSDLLPHVDLVEVLDRAVMQPLDLADGFVGHLSAQGSYVHREALRVARVLCQPVETLYEHSTAPGAVHPPALELEVDAPVSH